MPRTISVIGHYMLTAPPKRTVGDIVEIRHTCPLRRFHGSVRYVWRRQLQRSGTGATRDVVSTQIRLLAVEPHLTAECPCFLARDMDKRCSYMQPKHIAARNRCWSTLSCMR